MNEEPFKPDDDVTWSEETRDGPVARTGRYMGQETLGSERCAVIWTHPNGAAMLIPLHRVRKAKRRL